jgi:hypothetical protein
LLYGQERDETGINKNMKKVISKLWKKLFGRSFDLAPMPIKLPPRQEADSTIDLLEGKHRDLPKTTILSGISIWRPKTDRVIGFALSKKWRDQGNRKDAAYATAWYIKDGETYELGPMNGVRVHESKMKNIPNIGDEIVLYLTDLNETERTNAVANVWGRESK